MYEENKSEQQTPPVCALCNQPMVRKQKGTEGNDAWDWWWECESCGSTSNSAGSLDRLTQKLRDATPPENRPDQTSPAALAEKLRGESSAEPAGAIDFSATTRCPKCGCQFRAEDHPPKF
jgi:hypothetical protein